MKRIVKIDGSDGCTGGDTCEVVEVALKVMSGKS